MPAGLVALGLVPVPAGALRLVEPAGGPPLASNGERYHPVAPVPLVAHIVAVSAYSVLGALQFAARFRARRPGWHRAAGRLLVPCGLVGALSALWPALVHHGPDEALLVLTGWLVNVVVAERVVHRSRRPSPALRPAGAR
ncbi:DUF2306 domain-containing protein [Saccharothrix lopnurensis]|uniref:DUF2306 domain-containing protein n=1 Tax=Saccharothrix lopnurensis TaxID=1670621 RepID=A0ABW1P054_9PSEU